MLTSYKRNLGTFLKPFLPPPISLAEAILFNPHLRILFLLIVRRVEGREGEREREGREREINVRETHQLIVNSLCNPDQG